jgi:hypothetical protein
LINVRLGSTIEAGLPGADFLVEVECEAILEMKATGCANETICRPGKSCFRIRFLRCDDNRLASRRAPGYPDRQQN